VVRAARAGGVDSPVVRLRCKVRGVESLQVAVVLKRFESPDETRIMEKGRFELIRIGGLMIGRATYEPGWRWSLHVGPSVGAARCSVEHVGLVLSGTATAAFEDGHVYELRAGQVFYIPPVPHDSWVVGDEPYVSLHLLGSEHYAR
jgi:quercetin dioxygenase-like cupin family protein